MGDPYVTWGVLFLLGSLAAAMATHYHYTKRSYMTFPPLTHVCIVLSVFICILPFPLLVLDVDAGLSAMRAGHEENSEHWFRPIWLMIFFLTQIMAWIVLPIAQEFDGAGEFTTKRKLVRAVKENVKLYLLLGVVVGGLFGYIIFMKGVRSFDGIVSLVLAAANAFGLALICVFLACGLVGMPRMLWRSADPTVMLRRYYFEATDIQEDVDVAAMDLAEVKAELSMLTPRVTDEDATVLQQMLEMIQKADNDLPFYHSASTRTTMSSVPDDGDVSREKLVKLHAKMKRSIKIATKKNYQWEHMIRECQVLDAVINQDYETIGQRKAMYFTLFRKPLYYALAAISFVLTILVLFSELVLPFQQMSSSPLSVVELAVQNEKFQFVGSVVFLFYMATCSYWATFQFKVFDVFHVLPSVSDAASLCFTATFLTRLILPLCYNFLWISDLTDAKYLVTYSKLFGSMDVVQFLGPVFNRFLPVLIPIIAAMIELKIFDKILQSVGIDRHDPNNIYSDEVLQRINDGRKLVQTHTGKEMSAVSPHDTAAAGTAAVTVSAPEPKEAQREKGARYAEWKAKKAAEKGGVSDQVEY